MFIKNMQLFLYNLNKGSSLFALSAEHIIEPSHDKTNKVAMRPTKTQISLGIRPVWSEPSLCAHQWVAKDPRFLHADSKVSDQTGRMTKLIWVFAGRTLTLLVLSCRGSYFYMLPLGIKLTQELLSKEPVKLFLQTV